MTEYPNRTANHHSRGFMARLARDTSGNTMAIVAASLAPMLAIVGGGIDMARSYLSESRLQQACDAGTLAARQKLGPAARPEDGITADAQTIGDKYFALNYNNGAYGSENRTFSMAMETDASITGTATVDVPTSIMRIFGNDKMAITVKCASQSSMSNTDIMFVLDVTGSMQWSNPGDTVSRIDAMKQTVKDFHAKIESTKNPAARVRYGAVPYATNVNVGGLLKSDWLVDSWTYQARQAKAAGSSTANFYAGTRINSVGTSTAVPESLLTTCPADTVVSTWSAEYDIVAGPPREYTQDYTRKGIDYYCTAVEGGFKVTGYDFDLVETYRYIAKSETYDVIKFDYLPRTYDVSAAKDANGDAPAIVGATLDTDTYSPTSMTTYWFDGCIEERSTYEIADYSSVDLSQALDLDIDLVPTPGAPDTQWRPKFTGLGFARAMYWSGGGTWSIAPVLDTSDEYFVPAWMDDLSSCPTPAAKLAEWDTATVTSYIDSLAPAGKTYHDIGMIWGGRLMSPTGLFASENADAGGITTSRHLIFLTDGQTEPYDLGDGAYGIEPLDQRRWSPSSPLSQNQMVEQRFLVACDEVKKRNITIWLIAFGTEMNAVMKQCAGPGRYYEAADAAALSDAFSDIAGNIGELRLTK